jgi:acylphosphatase
VRIAKHYVVSGRVQGVGFRYFTQRAAARHGISGWVRNTPEGFVEIEAEGDAEAMRQFEDDIATGPAGARVDQVDKTAAAVAPNRTGFSIR